MNGYILNTAENFHLWGSYDYEKSISHLNFLEGKIINEKNPALYYRISKKSYVEKVKSAILFQSLGVWIVNHKLKEILERVVPNYNIQFFPIKILYKEEEITELYAINISDKISCVEIEKSEFRITNFDPKNPQYMFYYMKLKENIFEDYDYLDIVICKENPQYIVVSEKIKKELFKEKIKNLEFWDSVDMTYQNRTICEKYNE